MLRKIFSALWLCVKLIIIIFVSIKLFYFGQEKYHEYFTADLHSGVLIKKVNRDKSITNVEVPYYIWKSKDCSKYLAWTSKNFSHLLRSIDKCLWNDVTRIIEFSSGEDIFDIPAQYTVYEWAHSDKESGVIALIMKYPEMTEATGPDYFELGFGIIPSSKYNCQDGEICTNGGLQYYRYNTHIHSNLEKNIPNKIEKIRELPEENWTEYKINGEQCFIRGNPLTPTEWIKCLPPIAELDSSCHTVMHYQNNVYIKYDINKEIMIKDYDTLNVKVLEKVKSWHRQQKSSPQELIEKTVE